MISYEQRQRIEYKGETKTIREWADVLGVTADCIRGRLHKGWTVEDALSIPNDERRALPAKPRCLKRKGRVEELPARNWMTGL